MRFLMKFGGTSVADTASVGKTVDIIEDYHRAGHEVAVVVSAQRGVTDQLIAIAQEIANSRSPGSIRPFIQAFSINATRRLLQTWQEIVPEKLTIS